MSNRAKFKMTEEDYKVIVKAARPTPVMYLTGGQSMFPSPQENINRAWEELGKKMGFDGSAVTPDPQGDRLVFYAVPVPIAETTKPEPEKGNMAKRKKLSEEQAKIQADARSVVKILGMMDGLSSFALETIRSAASKRMDQISNTPAGPAMERPK